VIGETERTQALGGIDPKDPAVIAVLLDTWNDPSAAVRQA